MEPTDWQMFEAGEPAYRRLPRTDEEAIVMLARSANTQKKRQSLERYAMNEGISWDEKGYSHLAP